MSNEMTVTEHAVGKSQRRLMMETGWTLIKAISSHPATFMEYRTMRPDEQRYVRPPRQYDIPLFHKGMKYSTSNDRYLRATRWCNPREPEIIAMANELGAYELSDREFADAAYWFVKDNITFEMRPNDGVEATLRRGTGACFHYVSLFIALCRAAGIKGRYKTFAMNYDRYAQGGGIDPLWDDLYNTLGYLMSEAEAEVYIGGEWMVAWPAASVELQAARYLPITKFGEDAIGVFYDAVPGTIQHIESLPLGMSAGMKILFRLMPGSPERVNAAYQRAAAYGRQVIAEAGGKDAYDQKARRRLQAAALTFGPKDDKALVFEE